MDATPALRSLAWVAATEARSEAPRRRWISTGVSVVVENEGAAIGTGFHGCVMHRIHSA